MALHSSSLALAGIFICISAALHVTAVIVGGLHVSTVALLIVGIGFFALGRGFLAGSDLWDKPAVALMLLGVLGAAAMPLAVPHWWLTLMIWADIAVALFLVAHVLRRSV